MKLSEEAKTWLNESTKEMKKPVIAVVERVYRGWCGTQKVTQVMPVEESDIPDPSTFVVKEQDGWQFYVDKAVERSIGKMTIDVAGWSTFKRLIILEN